MAKFNEKELIKYCSECQGCSEVVKCILKVDMKNTSVPKTSTSEPCQISFNLNDDIELDDLIDGIIKLQSVVIRENSN